MSASDAFAAIHVIHTIVSKVKDNKDELNSLSKRLQFIVQALEESRERDVLRDAEYEDSLSAVFEMITRAERVTRRMLKRSLGDRTWNAREIASELKRLNDDAQTFVALHTMKTLDIVHTTHSQQQSLILNSVEEIIAKITELDTALLKPKPAPGGARPSFKPRTTTPRGSTRSILPQARHQFPPASTANTAAAPSRQDKTWEREEEPNVLVDKLRSSNMFTVTISGLHKAGESSGPGPLEATFSISGAATVQQIKDTIEEAGYQRPEDLSEDRTMFLKVTEGDSVFDASAPGGLQISQDEPLLWWMNRYEEYHGISNPIPMKTEVEWTRESLKVDNLTIACHRTLRVPDSDNATQLPPDMGPFPLFPVTQLGSKVPEEMKTRGGFIMPMFRREALWISFDCGFQSPAVKISVGGVNVISGVSDSALDPSPLKNGPQDYVVAGSQPWIDGIVTGPGVFVVTEMREGYTVEEQVTGEAKVGGLQFDIFPRRPEPLGAFYRTKTAPGQDQLVADEIGSPFYAVDATPQELGLAQCTIAFIQQASPTPAPQNLSEYARRISSTTRLKAKYPDQPVEPLNLYDVCTFDYPPSPLGTPLGIAPGGRIKQNVYRDPDSVRVYDEQLGRRFHIHIVTPEFWEDLTGMLPPITPVTRELYATQGIPWYKLYDDYVESITETSDALAALRSVAEFDRDKSQNRVKVHDPVVDPDAPPPCFQHPLATSSCVFRPCGHAVCALCLGHTLIGGSKCNCGSPIAKFVGMKQPLPYVEAKGKDSDDGLDHWTIQEIEQLSTHAVQSGKVIIIHRPEDEVAPLQQRDHASSLSRD